MVKTWIIRDNHVDFFRLLLMAMRPVLALKVVETTADSELLAEKTSKAETSNSQKWKTKMSRKAQRIYVRISFWPEKTRGYIFET